MTEQERSWRIGVVGFDHMHAGDFIRCIQSHPRAEIAGLWDSNPDRIARVAADFDIASSLQFTDIDEFVAAAHPDLVVVCSTTHDHAKWVGHFASLHIDVIVEKPFATSLAEADAMIAAAEAGGITLAVNWPLAWYPTHRTTQRLIAEGAIGDVVEVHYYDGNRGPLNHLHDKKSREGALTAEEKRKTWWYQAENGGGSLLDYLGYGATLSTWFRDGELPREITAVTHTAPGDEVDEQSVVIAEFPAGLSTLQTRWGTFTDPWTNQPQPRCGFVVVGTEGTIASYDYADHVTIQTSASPAGENVTIDEQPLENTNGLAHVIHALETGERLSGPLSWQTSRAGQRIVDSAILSASMRATVALLDGVHAEGRTAETSSLNAGVSHS
jgi:predicted dehydrogenase